MKDCWQEDPDKRLEFTGIERRLNNPFNRYEVITATESEEFKGTEAVDAARPGNLLFC